MLRRKLIALNPEARPTSNEPVPPPTRELLAKGLLPYSGQKPDRRTMTPAHQLSLIERYPGLYRHAATTPTMTVEPFAREGFACGDGWFGILDRLSAKLVADPRLVVGQVKEKMGVLRVYFAHLEGVPEPDPELDDRLDAEVEAAREESRHTCEICGRPSPEGPHTDINHWITVRCESCGWLDDMILACGFLAEIADGKTLETFAADRCAVILATDHITRHLGAGARHQPRAVRRRFPLVNWPKLDLWATIDSTDRLERADGYYTKSELDAMVFRVTPGELWKFITEDVPLIKKALR